MPPKPGPSKAQGGRGKPAPARGGATRGAARGGGARGAKAAQQSKPTPKTEEKKSVVYKWSHKDDAAVKIQKLVRRFLARKYLERKRKEKEDYEKEMDRLEKEAMIQIVRMQQEEAERERQKEEEERRRIMEHNKRKKKMLEAAFDGDKNEMIAILKEVADADTKKGLGNDVIGKALRNRHQLEMINCEDANKNTPLSEAASGGDPEAIKFLIDKGADVNSRGQFQRTPLWRAAFAGHLSACEVLLENGADPRIYAEDTQKPEDVASVPTVKEFIAAWDINRTEVLLKKIEKDREARAVEEKKRQEAELNNIQKRIENAQKSYNSQQKRLNKAYEEMNKRILEHDKAALKGFERLDLTEKSIHDAEMEVESAKIDFDKARDELSKLKLELRIKEKEEGMDSDKARPGIECPVRDLDDVLFKDVGNQISDTGKWPMVVDPSGQAVTFLRYRDTNYLNALRPSSMTDESIRLAILGSLRFGKPLILDLMEVDGMFATCSDLFDHLYKGLMNNILDKSIIQESNYKRLIKSGDDPEYDKNKFNDLRTRNFKFFLVVKTPFPPDNLLELFTPVWVIIAGKK